MGANMPLSKAVLLKSAEVPRRTVDALKASNGRPQNKVMSRGLRGQFLFCRHSYCLHYSNYRPSDSSNLYILLLLLDSFLKFAIII